MLKKFFTLVLLGICFCGYSQNKIAYLSAAELSTTAEKTPKIHSNSTNFELANGLITVKAQVNGKIGKFILDTGAPGLVLNSNEKTGKIVKASSINSSIEINAVKVENFQWVGFEKKNVDGYALDISHMKRGPKSPDGLIGYQILKNNAVWVDFQNKEIAVLSKKDLKKKINSSENITTIPFITDGHLPILKLKINSKTYRFALDTGAEQNLLNEALFEITKPKNIKYELMQGLDGGIHKVAVGELVNLKSKNYEIEKMKFLYSDLPGVTSTEFDYQIHGLLGLPFFQNKTFVIDYRNGRLHIWE